MEITSVSSLHEYCARNKLGLPTYNYISDNEVGFVCEVQILDMKAIGNGRSKRDAKHLAALNLMNKIKKADSNYPTSNNIESEVVDELTNLNRDMLKELRDYCVQHDMPLPIIEIVQQSGTPNAPQFVACCTVASIKRFGKSDKKKDARQRAAIAMLYEICNADDGEEENMQLATNSKPTTNKQPSTEGGGGGGVPTIEIEDLEAERRLKFKTYFELTESGIPDSGATKLCDRHNYFSNYFPHLKTAALAVIASDEYESSKERALQLLRELKLTPKITQMKSSSLRPVVKFVVNCEYNCVILGYEDEIYDNVLSYFRVMLI